MAAKDPRREELQEEHWERTIALLRRVTIRAARGLYLPNSLLVSAAGIPLAD